MVRSAVIIRTGLVVCAGLLVAACGSSSKGSAGSSTPTSAAAASMSMPTGSTAASAPASPAVAASEPVVHIKDFQFSAPSSPITAGEKFKVINDDSAPHTYETVKKGVFDSGTINGGGGAKEITAPAAGTYDIKCDFHPSMHGSLTVG